MRSHPSAAFVLGLSMAWGGAAMAGEVDFSLTHLDRIELDEAGLKEPSGLALADGGKALWIVDDSKGKVFEVDLDGDLRRSFEIDATDLEGIALDPSGERLLAVEEAGNTILVIDLEAERVVGRHPLEAMAGFDRIADQFDDPKKGLEGITVDPRSGNILVLKEGEPGLLIEVSADLTSIVEVRPLGAANGFIDDDLEADEIDYSGITYDARRTAFWIVSDKARRLYLYDWGSDRVIQTATLGYGRKGDYEEIDKAEGIAIDPETGRLYVVSDDETRLYVFDLR